MAKILVIEDDDMIREMLGDILRESGHQSVVAADGSEGLKKFRRSPVEMVITDIFMPNIHGLEVIKKLREYNPTVKIIAISGSGAVTGVNVRQYAMEVGANCYIRKPFKIDILLSAVEALLLRTDSQSENSGEFCYFE